MLLKVLISPDKFKGNLSASDAAQAIARGWHRARPHDSLELVPITDGGDGFGAVISTLLRALPESVKTVDAAHRSCLGRWWWDPKRKTAVIESASIIGLAMLPPKKFHPFALDTFGLGAVIRAATEKGAKRCLMGIGGSATNDGGFGLARALGWEFLNARGHPIQRWTSLDSLAKIRPPRRCQFFRELVVAVDVQNPLVGPRGATRIYGPQKGLRSDEFALAERCLRHLARVVKIQFGRNLARQPGAGAAGGLGFGLLTFLGARLEPGFDLFSKYASLDDYLHSADLVITGEGSIDESTLMGKGVGEIARRCRRLKIPCLGLAGVLHKSPETRKFFAHAAALTELTTKIKARTKAAFWLERLAAQSAAGAGFSRP